MINNKLSLWEQVSFYKPRIPILKKIAFFSKIQLAKQYIKLLSQDLFIGVLGTFNKSVCIEALKAILSVKFKTISTNLDSDPIFNIPSTILKISPDIKKVVLELGVREKGIADFYLSIFHPKVLIFTKLFPSLSKLGVSDEILSEHIKLLHSLPQGGLAILNWDDINSKKIAENCNADLIYYGTDAKNCTVWAGNIQIQDFKTSFELNHGVERVKVNLQLLGSHQIYPVLAAATFGVLNKIPLTKIKLALESIKPQDHKFQALLGPHGAIILDDSHNSSPYNLHSAIDTLLKIPGRRRILILGEILQKGAEVENLYRSIAQIAYKEKIDQVILGTGDINIIADELKTLGFWDEKVVTNLQNSQLVSRLLKNLGKGDVCLIKGSKAVRLDEVVKRIAKKQ